MDESSGIFYRFLLNFLYLARSKSRLALQKCNLFEYKSQPDKSICWQIQSTLKPYIDKNMAENPEG